MMSASTPSDDALGLSAAQSLVADTFDLWGSRLIEASAGTGKTWTIAALYVRLVLGHGGDHGFVQPLLPSQILVMTFTRAATRELSDRIRARLIHAAQCFRGEKRVDAHDVFLTALLQAYPLGPARQRAAWLLAMAAESMDDASVYTIDGWCQRVLKEHAFESGRLCDEELIADESAMRIMAAQDYWRQEAYLLPPDLLAVLLDVWASVDALISDMQQLQGMPCLQDLSKTHTDHALATLQQVMTQTMMQRKQAVADLKQDWAERAQNMQDWLDAQTARPKNGWDGRKLQSRFYGSWLNALADWAKDPAADARPDLKTGWHRLTPDGLQEARKDPTVAIDLPADFAALAELSRALDDLPQVDVVVRLHAVAKIEQRLQHLKQQNGSFGFLDLQQRLDAALSGPSGPTLRQSLLAQYPVALIDEFQDTSPLQYRIFDQIYRIRDCDPQYALLLIGDPKQSIYGFRGADIDSYLQARMATSGRHAVLQTNYRSTHALVEGVNHWFARADRLHDEGAFGYGRGVASPLPFVPVAACGRPEQFVTSAGAAPAMTLLHDPELCNTATMRERFAAHCAEQVVAWLNDPKAGFATEGLGDSPPNFVPDLVPIRPADIAILVRTGTEAAAVQHELTRRGVVSVYLSDKDSVFQSAEARDLVYWLQAVAAPQDMRALRTGLATATVGLSLAELVALARDDELLDQYANLLRQLGTVWRTQGVLAMLRQTLHRLGLPARWLSGPGGERKLTNVLHLAELLQSASADLEGEQALIRWLCDTTSACDDSRGTDEAQVVRLESDADLVKVITIHKSKGLEYPLVCIPFAASCLPKTRKNTAFVQLKDDTGQSVLRLQPNDDDLVQADRARLREDLRLFYVALTRARHALWLGFSAIQIGKGAECASHRSGCGYLLGGPSPVAAAGWLPLMEQLALDCQGIRLQSATAVSACTPLTYALTQPPLQDRPVYQASFDRQWTIASFSSLVKSMPIAHQQMPRPADDEDHGHHEASVLDAFVSTAMAAPTVPEVITPHGLAKGARFGNFVHEQMQWLATQGFALPTRPQLVARLQQRTDRAGYHVQAEQVLAWLTDLVQTPLPGLGVALTGLSGHVLPEMEFWLPLKPMNIPNTPNTLDARQIDALCQRHLWPGLARPCLGEHPLHGVLMGFADLVFEHQDRYWVLDYKSNHLGDTDGHYGQDALMSAMLQHRYDVQATLYMLALHRLLRQRLGCAYRIAEHLGGAVYWFVRGVHGPQNGVCLIPVCIPLIEGLDALLPDIIPTE